MRIAKAVKEDRWNKVYTLQRLLTRSFYAKLLAVTRVTSNKHRGFRYWGKPSARTGTYCTLPRRLSDFSLWSQKAGVIIREHVSAPLPALLKHPSWGNYHRYVVASVAYHRGATTGALPKGVLLECLSRMTGNSQVR